MTMEPTELEATDERETIPINEPATEESEEPDEPTELEASDEPETDPLPEKRQPSRVEVALQNVMNAQHAVAEQAAVVAEMAADLKEEKKELKEREAYLHKLISGIRRGENELPFYDQDEAVQAADSEPGEEPEPEEIVDDAAGFSIDVLALAPKLTEHMKAAGLNTVGQLEEQMRTDDWWHKQIERCGPASVDKITDALMEFRKAHPVPVSELEADESEELDAAETEGDLILPEGVEDIIAGSDPFDFSSLCERWATKAAELPVICKARSGWIDTLAGIAGNVEDTSEVTEEQRIAVENIIAAVHKWNREAQHPALQD